MKRGIILVAMAISLSCLPEWAVGRGGNLRYILNQKWNQAQAWQERQNQKFKAIEREAERMLRDMDSNEGVSQKKPRGKGY